MDQDRLARLETAYRERLPGGESSHGDGCGLNKVQRLRLVCDLGGTDDGILRIGPLPHHVGIPKDGIPYGEACHVRANLGDNAGEVESQRPGERDGDFVLEMAGASGEINRVNRGGMDRDEHLVGSDGRRRRVLIADHLWAAVAVNADCFHDLLLCSCFNEKMLRPFLRVEDRLMQGKFFNSPSTTHCWTTTTL